MVVNPQVLHQDMLIESPQPSGPVKMPGFPVKLSITPAQVRLPAPQPGEHSRTVLDELGYSRDSIEELIAEGVVETLK